MFNTRFQRSFIYGGFLCLAILGVTYLFERTLGLTPCPLCLLQRYTLWGVTLCFWLGALQNCKGFGRFVYSGFIIVLSAIGGIIAARHLWIQYWTPQHEIADCMAGFETIFAYQPFMTALKTIFSATEDCTRIDFSLLGLSLPAWSLFTFMGIFSFTVVILGLQIKRRM